MVNASLNWASIVGIVLAVGGAALYFMRSFKPALARDYDVFFAAIGLLCGGILFFQGWRLDPILQFGQFLLAGTTVFFAYESVRLRGVATEQARRSSYFDDEPAPERVPAGGPRGGWNDDQYDRFEEPQPLRRRFTSRDGDQADRPEEDFYRPRRASRAAIPEQAESRRRSSSDGGEEEAWSPDNERSRRMARFGRQDEPADNRSNFGERRSVRQEQRRGSRPAANQQASGRPSEGNQARPSDRPTGRDQYPSTGRSGVPQGTPMRPEAEDAAFSPAGSRPTGSRPAASRPRESRPTRSPGSPSSGSSTGGSVNPSAAEAPSPRSAPSSAPNPSPSQSPNPNPNPRQSPRSSRPRDNTSRFDD
ncbi:MAG: Ycf66 family protein [Prochlorococcus sp.]